METKASQYSELELALNTLVTKFHGASANNSPTLNSTQFQTLISEQLPTYAKTVNGADGLNQVLNQMGVENGQNVTFEKFWNLIKKLADDQFDMKSNEKKVKCTCLLQ